MNSHHDAAAQQEELRKAKQRLLDAIKVRDLMDIENILGQFSAEDLGLFDQEIANVQSPLVEAVQQAIDNNDYAVVKQIFDHIYFKQVDQNRDEKIRKYLDKIINVLELEEEKEIPHKMPGIHAVISIFARMSKPTDSRGNNAAHYAVIANRAELIDIADNKDSSCLSEQNKDGKTPLHLALERIRLSKPLDEKIMPTLLKYQLPPLPESGFRYALNLLKTHMFSQAPLLIRAEHIHGERWIDHLDSVEQKDEREEEKEGYFPWRDDFWKIYEVQQKNGDKEQVKHSMHLFLEKIASNLREKRGEIAKQIYELIQHTECAFLPLIFERMGRLGLTAQFSSTFRSNNCLFPNNDKSEGWRMLMKAAKVRAARLIYDKHAVLDSDTRAFLNIKRKTFVFKCETLKLVESFGKNNKETGTKLAEMEKAVQQYFAPTPTPKPISIELRPMV